MEIASQLCNRPVFLCISGVRNRVPSRTCAAKAPSGDVPGAQPLEVDVAKLVSRKLVTAVVVIGAVLPVAIAWGATDFSYGGTPRYLLGMTQTSGAAYRNYDRISGTANDTKYLCYGPVSPAGNCYPGTTLVSNSSFLNIGPSGSFGYGTAAAKCGTYVTLWVDCHTTQP
jgi:hypothetical protein